MKKLFLLSVLFLSVFAFFNVEDVNAKGLLIKSEASGTAVYYLDYNDGKRYVFPNEVTYKTWFEDYSNVTDVSDDYLASYPLGGNIVFRPGTRMIKLTTDPKVYVVGKKGYLHWLSSEDLAKKLYGENWSDLVSDVSDAFFLNYKIGADIDYETYIDGSLIKYADSSTVYMIEKGRKVVIPNQYTMTLFNFNYDYIQTCPDYKTFESRDAEFSYTENDYFDVSQSGIEDLGGALHDLRDRPDYE